MKRTLFVLTLIAATSGAAEAEETVKIEPPAEGSVSKEDGLKAWARIYAVASHPRCANCHVGASDQPMWSGPSYGSPGRTA